MKKIIAIAIGMMLVPFTAFGMQTATDESMEGVQGQSGVAIAVDDIVIYEDRASEELWYSGGEGDAYVGITWDEGSETMMHIDALGEMAQLDTDMTYDDFTPQVLTIRTMEDLNIMSGEEDGTEVAATGIEIGLPTVMITHEEEAGDIMTIGMLTEADSSEVAGSDFDATFGTLVTSDGDESVMAILDGVVEIAPYSEAEALGLVYEFDNDNND